MTPTPTTMIDRAALKRTLDAMVSTPRSEAAFLHTISYLEFVGARKISRTVAATHPTLEVLDHLADETRHAYAFKRLAVEVGGASEPQYVNLDEARRMFYTLDQALSAWVREAVGDSEYLNYLLVTTMIERRAMQIYPLLRAATSSGAVKDELAKIVAEEQAHRVTLERSCVAALEERGLTLEPALAIEERAFSAFWRSLDQPTYGPYTAEPHPPVAKRAGTQGPATLAR